MCGICGVWNLGRAAEAVAEKVLLAMRDSMSHRGPDGAGVYVAPARNLGLAHRRLSIVDLAGGAQPMCNEDGTVWIVYNGEVYNHAELRPALERKGHVYKSRSDTETIIHLYEEYGEECVHRLRGMFAFAIWDERQKRLFLARDRVGIKPLYYTFAGGPLGGGGEEGGRVFLFGSEIKAILQHPLVHREVDPRALYDYLTFAVVPAPDCLFAGIKKLPAGNLLTIDSGGRLLEKEYWDPWPREPPFPVTASDGFYTENMIERLAESVRLRMMSDVPVGVFLSGGVDSSTNVALMSEIAAEPVNTFSVGFAGEEAQGYNELEEARRVARLFGTNHHEVVIGVRELVEQLPGLVYHQDEPIADPVCIPLYYVSKLAKEAGVTVVHVGEGSDEIFAGYDLYLEHQRIYEKVWRYYEKLPAFARRALHWTLGRGLDAASVHGKAEWLRKGAAGQPPFWGGAVAFSETLKSHLLSSAFRAELSGASSGGRVMPFYRWTAEANPGADYLSRMIYLELKIRLPELLLMRVDKVTMATSVEARVPFLDHRLVEFAMRVPAAVKTKGGKPKFILKKALAGLGLLPEDVIYRKKKGFSVPVREWAVTGLSDLLRTTLLESGIHKRGFFNRSFICWLLDTHQAGKSDFAFQLWVLFNLALWYDRWIGD